RVPDADPRKAGGQLARRILRRRPQCDGRDGDALQPRRHEGEVQAARHGEAEQPRLLRRARTRAECSEATVLLQARQGEERRRRRPVIGTAESEPLMDERLGSARLYFVVEADASDALLDAALRGGVDLLQLRDKDSSDDE